MYFSQNLALKNFVLLYRYTPFNRVEGTKMYEAAAIPRSQSLSFQATQTAKAITTSPHLSSLSVYNFSTTTKHRTLSSFPLSRPLITRPVVLIPPLTESSAGPSSRHVAPPEHLQRTMSNIHLRPLPSIFQCFHRKQRTVPSPPPTKGTTSPCPARW